MNRTGEDLDLPKILIIILESGVFLKAVESFQKKEIQMQHMKLLALIL